MSELEAAIDELRLDRIETLATHPPAWETLDRRRARAAMKALAMLAGRDPETELEKLGWLLSAVLMKPVLQAPRRRAKALAPIALIGLAVILGLLVGRMLAAGVAAVGLVIWAVRAGGAVRERHGAWLRLGDSIFDLRTVRVERLGDAWVRLEGRRVPLEAVRELAPEVLGP